MSRLLSRTYALAFLAPLSALAQSTAPNTEIQALRQEMVAMRQAYEARLQMLEQRLATAEQTAAPAPTSNTVIASSKGNDNSFNPAISLVLSGGYIRSSQDPASYSISGFQLPRDNEAGPGTRGFTLGESELGLQANIDPWWRGVANIALGPDNSASVEEAYVQTTALENGLTFKAGRFFSSVGYLNEQHAHTWDFADNPLAYQAMLGTQYGDDGVQLRWLAPTDQFLEFGLELGRGKSFPGGDNSRNSQGMSAFSVHTGGDVSTSDNWRAGLSMLNAKAQDQELAAVNNAGTLVDNLFSGKTRVWVLDGVWKWAPNGNGTRTNFKLQGEYLRSTKTGELTYDVAGANLTDSYRVAQSGWYLQGVYQFMPRWRVGLRTERLNPGSTDSSALLASVLDSSYKPRKNTLMLDYNPSEFSRIRLQFAQDKARAGLVDNQVFLQYQMSLGAHGAHLY